MTPEIEQAHLKARAACAAGFIANPKRFKVCDQCSSVSFVESRVCGVCHAYRWDLTPEKLIEVAKIIGAKPWPEVGGIAPRVIPKNN